MRSWSVPLHYIEPEKLSEERDVFRFLSERRQRQGNGIQPIEEIFPKPSAGHELLEVMTRVCDHPQIQRDGLVAADSSDFPFL